MAAVDPKLNVGLVTEIPSGPWIHPIVPKLDVGLVTEIPPGPWGNPIAPKLGVGLVTELVSILFVKSNDSFAWANIKVKESDTFVEKEQDEIFNYI